MEVTKLTGDLLEGLLDEWRDSTRHCSLMGHAMRNPAFEELKQFPAEQLIPVLLRRLRDDSISMFYQGLLGMLAGEDLGVWKNVTPSMRAYNVRESAQVWLDWGKARGHIEDVVGKWNKQGYGPEHDRDLCYKCRVKQMEHTENIAPDDSVRVYERVCPDCGVLTRHTNTRVGHNDWKQERVRVWRTPEIVDAA